MYNTEQENKNQNKIHVKRKRARRFNDEWLSKPLFIDRSDHILYTHAYTCFFLYGTTMRTRPLPPLASPLR